MSYFPRRLAWSLLVLFSLIPARAAPAQEQPTGAPPICALTGSVTEATPSAEPLPGAHVLVPAFERGTMAGADGSFTLGRLPCGSHRVRVTHLGHVPFDTTLVLPTHAVTFHLRPATTELDEVVVSDAPEETELGAWSPSSTIEVSALPIEKIPVVLGEPDLIRVIQHLPGVKTESDFSGRFYVRGGRGDQNLVLLDGAPVYSPWHLFGLFSAFNTEAVERVELVKGVPPPQYGGRLSSLLDVELQDGSGREGAGHLNVSILSATGSYGRPLSDRTSFLVAARRTYMDPIFWIADQHWSAGEGEMRTRYNFADVNAKVTHRFRTGPGRAVHHRLTAGVFYGQDWFSSDDRDEDSDAAVYRIRIGWQNTTGTVRLESDAAGGSLVQQAHASRYTADTRFLDEYRSEHRSEYPPGASSYRADEVRFRQQLREVGYRAHGTWDAPSWGQVLAGGHVVHHAFVDDLFGGERTVEDEGGEVQTEATLDDARSSSALAVGGHLGARLREETRTGTFTLRPGLRAERYAEFGGMGETWLSVLPRVSATLALRQDVLPGHITLSAGYGRTVQYLHVVGNEQLGLPTDRWLWTGADVAPARAKQLTVGAAWDVAPGRRVQVEAYRKQIEGLRAYSPIALYEAAEMEELPIYGAATVGGGRGTAYGLEVFVQKTTGAWTGWMGYTWSRSLQRFQALNDGRAFPARTDRPHDLQLALTRHLGSRWRVGAVFNLKSGQPATFARSGYLPEPDPLDVGAEAEAEPFVVTKQNSHRLPVYHRLDLSVTKEAIITKRPGTLTFSIINVYNRHNPFLVVAEPELSRHEGGVVVRPSTLSISQFPILPMLSARIDLSRQDPQ